MKGGGAEGTYLRDLSNSTLYKFWRNKDDGDYNTARRGVSQIPLAPWVSQGFGLREM